jgi:hypothetical protein
MFPAPAQCDRISTDGQQWLVSQSFEQVAAAAAKMQKSGTPSAIRRAATYNFLCTPTQFR